MQMDWIKLKRKFPNSEPKIREHLLKTNIKDSRSLIEDFLQKLKNIRNWLDDNGVMAVAEGSNELEALPIQRVRKSYCSCEKPKYNYPEMVWCDICGLEIKY